MFSSDGISKPPGRFELEAVKNAERNGYQEYSGWVRNSTHGETCPAIAKFAAGWKPAVGDLVDRQRKSGLFQGGRSLKPAVKKFAGCGRRGGVVSTCCIKGEFNTDGKSPHTESRRSTTPGNSWDTLGYNHPLFSSACMICSRRSQVPSTSQSPPAQIHLVGEGRSALVAAAQQSRRAMPQEARSSVGRFSVLVKSRKSATMAIARSGTVR